MAKLDRNFVQVFPSFFNSRFRLYFPSSSSEQEREGAGKRRRVGLKTWQGERLHRDVRHSSAFSFTGAFTLRGSVVLLHLPTVLQQNVRATKRDTRISSARFSPSCTFRHAVFPCVSRATNCRSWCRDNNNCQRCNVSPRRKRLSETIEIYIYTYIHCRYKYIESYIVYRYIHMSDGEVRELEVCGNQCIHYATRAKREREGERENEKENGKEDEWVKRKSDSVISIYSEATNTKQLALIRGRLSSSLHEPPTLWVEGLEAWNWTRPGEQERGREKGRNSGMKTEDEIEGQKDVEKLNSSAHKGAFIQSSFHFSQVSIVPRA